LNFPTVSMICFLVLGAISGFCQVVVPAGMTLTQISYDVFWTLLFFHGVEVGSSLL
jgi:hypothetical protein